MPRSRGNEPRPRRAATAPDFMVVSKPIADHILTLAKPAVQREAEPRRRLCCRAAVVRGYNRPGADETITKEGLHHGCHGNDGL